MQFLDIEKPREGKLMIFESGSVMWLQSRCLPGFPSSKDLTGLEVPKWLLLGGLSSHHMSNSAVQVFSWHGAWLSLVRMTPESKKKGTMCFYVLSSEATLPTFHNILFTTQVSLFRFRRSLRRDKSHYGLL